MRVSWYADTEIAVFSIWQGGTCTGTFRLPIPELPRMIEALRKGPPGAAGRGSRSPAAPGRDWQSAEPTRAGPDPGPPTAAIDMTPELAPDVPAPAARRPGGDYPPPGYPSSRPAHDRPDPLRDPSYASHQGPERDAGYPHEDYEEFPPGPEIPITSGSYRDAPGYRYDTPDQDYQDHGPDDGYQDMPPPGYDRPARGSSYGDAPPGYQDARQGFGEASRGGYDDFGPAADPGPPGGYQDAPRHWQAAQHQGPPPPDEEPAPAGYASAGLEDRPPTGPLPVGRWQGDQGGRQYPGGPDPLSSPAGGYAGNRERGYGGHPEPGYGGGRPDPGYTDRPEPGYSERPEPGYGGGRPEPGYGGHPEPGYGGHPEAGYSGSPEPDYGPGEPDGSFGFDPLGGDYTGEAEQGYLPGPPTETFRPVPPVSGYTGEASRHGAPGPGDGYEPPPDDEDDASAYSLRGRPDGLPSESFAYHPGRAESQDRDYRSSRRRS
jgi:hypothetical protein